MFLTIDIGGTSIKTAIYSKDAILVQELDAHPTPRISEHGDEVADLIVAIANDTKAQFPIKGVGISTTAMVHPEQGHILSAGPTMPNYAGTQLKKRVEAEAHLPCSVENDVNCAALGESWKGAGQNMHSIFCITVGTGIGGAILLDGKLWNGFNFTAGEVGFIPVPPKGDFWEDVASTRALLRDFEAQYDEKINGKILFERAHAGDVPANQAIDQLVANLVTGLLSGIYLLSPEAIIIGGGIAEQKEMLEPKINAELKRRILRENMLPRVVVCAELGNKAGMIGALRHLLNQHPQL